MARHRTVLLAEGEPALLDSLGFALRRRGYHVLTASGGSRAVELLARSTPDALVVGMLLAGASGFRVALLAKEVSAGALPVVMTAKTAAAHADYALALGIDRFLARPFAPADVAAAVELLCPLPASHRLAGSTAIPWRVATPA
jgi:DNA-binding response OmpR family regulator